VRTGRTKRLDADGVRAKLGWTLEGVRGRVDDGAREADRVLKQWLCARLRQPFFWFVNLTECHFPYLPPRPYGRLSAIGRALAAQDARRYYTLESVYRVCGRAVDVPPATLERVRRLYHGAIRYMDDWIARLLDRFDDLGILDETLVIVTADHGENFGEDHLIGHMLSLDNRLIHVPFVAAGPGADGLELNSLAALPARVAELVGLPDHPWQDGPPTGVGVAQAEPLGSESDPKLRQAMDEQGIDDAVGRARLTTPLTCAVRDGLKVLRRGEREQLFDLTADPLELEPLSLDDVEGPRARLVDELRSALDHPAMATAEAGPQPQAGGEAPTMSDAEKEDLERQMKLLGYL
jgi:arylsulfatase A-like enzyme